MNLHTTTPLRRETRGRRVRLRSWGALAAVPLAAGTLSLTSPAQADPSPCSFNRSTGTLTVGIPAEGTRRISQVDGFIKVESHYCLDGGSTRLASIASIHNVDLVLVEGSSGDERLIVEMTDGRFAPGRTAEAASSEIEFDIAMMEGSGDEVIVRGTSSADKFTLGTNGVNLNAREQNGIDRDMKITGTESVVFTGGSGDDELRGRGGAATGNPTALPLELWGDTGNDLLAGGGAADRLVDDAVLPPGPGEPGDTDTLRGFGGADTLVTTDYDALDSVDGGDGGDTCTTDNADQRTSC